MGLDSSSKAVNTPGRKQEGDETELSDGQASAYRGYVARAKYLAQYRCDIQYAVNELSRTMRKRRWGVGRN